MPMAKQSLLVIAVALTTLFASGDEITIPFPSPPRESRATSEDEMRPYSQAIPPTDVTLDMVPIRGGSFLMGSTANEPDRRPDEGPQHRVTVSPFWMAKYETTWDLYDVFRLATDVPKSELVTIDEYGERIDADGATRPTRQFMDQTFGMGHSGFPAINMTQLAAKAFCHWLTVKTGQYYRLPTEAEWEYACRAGTTTAYSWGNDPSVAADYACFYPLEDPVNEGYIKVGRLKPNPWGLFDMHGNVAEWCLDQYVPDFYDTATSRVADPIAVPKALFPRVVRGGSWYDDLEHLRSAARERSDTNWKLQDPQVPRSKWYHTDALHVGFRVVRPLKRASNRQIVELRLGPDPFYDTGDPTTTVPR